MSCLKCNRQGFKTKKLGLGGNDTYFQERECRHCHEIYRVYFPLVQDESGNYTTVYDGKSGRLLHQAIWELEHGVPIPAGTIIHHLNGKKRDNRPLNLYAIVAGRHKGTSNTIDLLLKRIQELEDEIWKIRLENF